MEPRRYSEEDVAEIFQRAAEAQQTARRRLPSTTEGMTLAELQEIGREVGIPAELVAQAARSLDHAGEPTSRSFLGLPIGVGRTIELDRKLSDAEWDRLVVDLRDTFDARGNLRQEGSFKQWTNGNLQALLEPTPTGHRLRLRTVKGEARGWLSIGAGSVAVGAALWLTSILGGGIENGSTGALFLALTGIGTFALAALRLPGWARVRRSQMEGVAARLALTPLIEPSEDPPVEQG
jgi:hypothetical protein